MRRKKVIADKSESKRAGSLEIQIVKLNHELDTLRDKLTQAELELNNRGIKAPASLTADEACTLAGLSDDVLQEELDEAVHNQKSEEGSNLNNQGMDAQLAYLEEVWGIEELENFLRTFKED